MKRCHVLTNWDVRMRLISAFAWLIGILFLKKIASPWILSAFACVLLAMDSETSLKKVGHQLLHAIPFVVLMLITLSLSCGIPLQEAAVEFALLLCSKVITGVLVVLAMIAGNGVDDFLRSIASLPIPPTFLSLLFLVNRYVNLLTKSFRQQNMALRSRMFVPKANPLVLKNIGYIVGGMFIRGYDRSEQVYAAMRARCYSGVIPYDEMRKIQPLDVIGLIFALVLLCATILLDWGLRG